MADYSNPVLRIKPGRERSILRHHPWIFSGAVAEVLGFPAAGETVDIVSAEGTWLGKAAYSPSSQIQARMWSWEKGEDIDRDFFWRKISQAGDLRRVLPQCSATNGVRLVHAESDQLPGLIVDRYGDWLVVQFLSCGSEYWRQTIIDTLAEIFPVKGIYERSDVEVRKLEGLSLITGLLMGKEPPELINLEENGLKYWVDIRAGHKTGFYLDQRENRLHIRQLTAQKDVLDCFCYTGGFTLASLAGGAKSIIAVDVSPAALDLVKRNIELNGLTTESVETVQVDVFHQLRKFRDAGRSFDVIILDPPKFAATSAQAERAARGYKDINMLALKLLRPGGFLATFSCSGGIDADLFQKILAGAAQDAGIHVQIVKRLHQAPDHPVSLNYPEGAYLKGLLLYKRPAGR